MSNIKILESINENVEDWIAVGELGVMIHKDEKELINAILFGDRTLILCCESLAKNGGGCVISKTRSFGPFEIQYRDNGSFQWYDERKLPRFASLRRGDSEFFSERTVTGESVF
jgi:hypothetical protein